MRRWAGLGQRDTRAFISTDIRTAPARPPTVKVAAILAFVQAGLAIAGATAGLDGGSSLTTAGLDRLPTVPILTTLGVACMVAGVVLIVGGLAALNGKLWLLSSGAVLSLAVSVWWSVQFDFIPEITGLAVLMAIMPILSIAFVATSSVREWVRSTGGLMPVTPVTGVPSAAAATTAGWNPDPARRHQLRFWDGTRWTAYVSDNGITTADPI